MRHVPCDCTFHWDIDPETVQLTVLGAHSDHRRPLPLNDPPSVTMFEVQQRMKHKQSAKSARVAGTVHEDAFAFQDPTGRRAQHHMREAYKRKYPYGTGFDGVDNWQEHQAPEKYVLESSGSAVHCATEWQQQKVKEFVEECISDPDGDRQVASDWQRTLFSDLTYSVVFGWYKMTSSVYSFKLRRSIPIFTSYQKGLDEESYAAHFYALLLHNRTLMKKENGKWTLATKGFLVDFSDSQRKGFLKACGMFILTKNGVLKTEPEYFERASRLGEQFAEFLHGCEFHFQQSVRKVVSNSKLVPHDQKKAFHKAIDKLLDEDESVFNAGIRELETNFPEIESWLKWWKMPQHASMIFPSKKQMPLVRSLMPRAQNGE